MSFPNEAGNVILWLQGALGFVALLVMVERMVQDESELRSSERLGGDVGLVSRHSMGWNRSRTIWNKAWSRTIEDDV